MSDVLNSQAPPINEPLGNSTEARNPDGSIKDTQTPPNPSQTTEETKPTDTKPEDKKPDETKPEDKPAGAPEKYELKAAEGKELSADLIAEATPLFKELNLTNDQAQKLTDFYNKQTGSISDKLDKMIADTRNGWRDTIAKDKTLGDGVDNLSKDSKKAIADAISWSGDTKVQEALKSALDLTGAGDHPDIVRAFVAFGKQMGEGKAVPGKGPSAAGQTQPGNARSAAQTLFPNLPSANG